MLAQVGFIRLQIKKKTLSYVQFVVICVALFGFFFISSGSLVFVFFIFEVRTAQIQIQNFSNQTKIQMNFAGILQKMKEGAEKVELKIQAKVESLKHANEGDKGTKTIDSVFAFSIFSLKQKKTIVAFVSIIRLFSFWNCLTKSLFLLSEEEVDQ